MTHLRAKKKIIFLLVTMALMLGLTTTAMAQNSYNIDTKSGDNVSIGSNVNAMDTVNGDAVAVGGNVSVNNGANGDVVSVGGNVNAKGNINGTITAVGGDVTVNGNVNGEVVAIGGKVILKGNTVVAGQVFASEIIKDPGVTIKGQEVKSNIPKVRIPYINGGSPFSLMAITLPFKIIGFILSFAIISLVFALYPNGVEIVAKAVEKDTWRVLVIGVIAWLILFPLFAIIIGIPLVIFLYIAAKFLGYAGVTLYMGRKFLNTINHSSSSTYLQIFVGMLLIGLLKFIPIVGLLIGLVTFWFSLGSMLDTKFGTGRTWFHRA